MGNIYTVGPNEELTVSGAGKKWFASKKNAASSVP
jgi:hypothetical protein